MNQLEFETSKRYIYPFEVLDEKSSSQHAAKRKKRGSEEWKNYILFRTDSRIGVGQLTRYVLKGSVQGSLHLQECSQRRLAAISLRSTKIFIKYLNMSSLREDINRK